MPESAGLAGGFVRFKSTVGVVAQLLFLAQDPQGRLTLFSVVPLTVIQ